MIDLEKDELILWKRKANMKAKGMKVPGTLFITNRKIVFQPLFAKDAIKMALKQIENIEMMRGLSKKIRIVFKGRDYVFFTREAESIVQLMEMLISQVGE